MKKKWLWAGLTILAICLLLYSCKGKQTATPNTVMVKKGTVKEKVIAVGSIIPKNTITVKSNISGIVGQLYHEEGEYVEQGAVLLQVAPSPTPQRIAEAHAEVKEHLALYEQTESHKNRLEKLVKMSLETPDNYSIAVKDLAMSKARLDMAQQKLALLQNGETTIAGKNIKTMISSPITGYILQRNVNMGDPVVPLTDMQEGTVLLTIANMQALIFKGSVNEIDVAKITPGMIGEIRIAALPDKNIQGTLRKVDLQSIVSTTEKVNSPFNVGFNIELNNLVLPKDIKLRAGYSATAEIIVKEATDVLILPERVLVFKDNKVFVNCPTKSKTPDQKEVKLGISDGINVQIIEGLKEGQLVLDAALSVES